MNACNFQIVSGQRFQKEKQTMIQRSWIWAMEYIMVGDVLLWWWWYVWSPDAIRPILSYLTKRKKYEEVSWPVLAMFYRWCEADYRSYFSQMTNLVGEKDFSRSQTNEHCWHHNRIADCGNKSGSTQKQPSSQSTNFIHRPLHQVLVIYSSKVSNRIIVRLYRNQCKERETPSC